VTDPPGVPPHPDPPEFGRGRLLPGVAAGCALPVVGFLLALILGLGLVVWSGTRPDPADPADPAGADAPAAPTQPPAASDR
jgi:hypothetical protein